MIFKNNKGKIKYTGRHYFEKGTKKRTKKGEPKLEKRFALHFLLLNQDLKKKYF